MSRALLVLICSVLLSPTLLAQDQQEARLQSLEIRVSMLETRIARQDQGAVIVPYLLLTGAFCALWAQNTGRSAWAWFFWGLFFHFITVLVLLSKNASDRRRRLEQPAPLQGPRVVATPTADGKKKCGSCGAIANAYAVRCHDCKAVFVEDADPDRA